MNDLMDRRLTALHETIDSLHVRHSRLLEEHRRKAITLATLAGLLGFVLGLVCGILLQVAPWR